MTLLFYVLLVTRQIFHKLMYFLLTEQNIFVSGYNIIKHRIFRTRPIPVTLYRIRIKVTRIYFLCERTFQGMIYLHESPIRFHGSLHTANCLVDSRWVVKLSDFGLREFKRGADDPSLKDPAKILEKCRSKYYYYLYQIPKRWNFPHFPLAAFNWISKKLFVK